MCPRCNIIAEKYVLCLGKVCLDIVHIVDQYPEEDSDRRSIEHWWHRGGNASNNCTVLSMLSQKCEYMGVLADAHGISFIRDSFKSDGILTDHVVQYKEYPTPTSVVLLNKDQGTRTIVHGTKGLPEISYENFKAIDLSTYRYKWIHFEGRPCVDEMEKMLRHIIRINNKIECPNLKIKTSLEIEKHRDGIEKLIPLVDVVFISKDYATYHGLKSKKETCEKYIKLCREKSILICPWGEDGAMAKTTDGQSFTSGIYPPEKVIDSLGAGDTFLAATIYSLSRDVHVSDAIKFGCKVAGAKCGVMGFHNLKTPVLKIVNND